MPLNAVNNSSWEVIVEALEDLKVNSFPNGRWLKDNNKYRYDIVGNLKKHLGDTKPGTNIPKRIYHTSLLEYTSTSSILNCSDGWTFLSRAIDSLISGDIPSAIFFTYYAELRALMSIFSVNGICILNYKHVYVNNKGRANIFGTVGTHDMVLKVLDAYINNNTKTSMLLDWLNVDGLSLKGWVGSGVGYLAKDWLEKWSMDVSQIRLDHNSRNEVSYRPQKLHNSLYSFSYKEDLMKIIEFWEVCEPTSSNFFRLDRYLLRTSLEAIFDQLPYRGVTSNSKRNKVSTSYKKDFERFITNYLNRLGKHGNINLKNFLIRVTDPSDSPLLIEANKPSYDKVTKQYSIIPMIARSLLLLRLATGGCEFLIKKSSIDRDDLEFWWADYGNKYGFWEVGDLPGNLKDDLWRDVGDAIQNLKDFCEGKNIDNIQSLKGFDLGDLTTFKQLNRIPLWSIGL